jgi:hypothetical protein
VNLVFYRGAEIPDPHRILKGTGKKMRHIRSNSLDDLRHGYLGAYIRQAIVQVRTTTAKSPRRNK